MHLIKFQIMSLKAKLDGRPRQEDFDDKLKQCNALRMELKTLIEQMASNKKLLDELQNELSEERKRHISLVERCLSDRGIQTDEIKIESTNNKVPVDQILHHQLMNMICLKR